jgi:hypothetical protein
LARQKPVQSNREGNPKLGPVHTRYPRWLRRGNPVSISFASRLKLKIYPKTEKGTRLENQQFQKEDPAICQINALEDPSFLKMGVQKKFAPPTQ